MHSAEVVHAAYSRVTHIESKEEDEKSDVERDFSKRVFEFESLFGLDSASVGKESVRALELALDALKNNNPLPAWQIPDPPASSSSAGDNTLCVYEKHLKYLASQARAAQRDRESEGAFEEDAVTRSASPVRAAWAGLAGVAGATPQPNSGAGLAGATPQPNSGAGLRPAQTNRAGLRPAQTNILVGLAGATPQPKSMLGGA